MQNFRTLTFLQMLAVYKREAASLTSRLPKGSIREANVCLREFIESEKETLRRWYYALQMRLLNVIEFRRLSDARGNRPGMESFKKMGVDRSQLKALSADLLSLLQETFVRYSGVEYDDPNYSGYRIRIYRLPDREIDQHQSGKRRIAYKP